MSTNIKTITGLQNLPNLENFNADYTSLVTVDFSGLTNLTYIDISDCFDEETGDDTLTSFNITGCTALEQIYVDDSDFSAGGFPSLTALTNLQRIDADQCNITGTIDLTNNTNLTYVDFNGNTEITSIVIGEQQIQNFDANNCALTETAINNILIALDENGIENGSVYLNGGTNAVPTGDGVSALNQLIIKNWDTSVNQAPPGYVGIAASTDFDIVGDFTIEMFVNMANVDGYPRPYSFGTYPAPNAISLESGNLYFWANESSLLMGNFAPTTGSWNHIAVMGSGSNAYMYVDGEEVASGLYSGTISSQGLPLTIGYGNESQSGFNGKMSNFRWTNSALYPTEGFTPPTGSLTSLEDTVLMIFQGTDITSQITDNSGNNHNATNSGATYSDSNPFIGTSGSLQMGNI
jgi:hypothetical protein